MMQWEKYRRGDASLDLVAAMKEGRNKDYSALLPKQRDAAVQFLVSLEHEARISSRQVAALAVETALNIAKRRM